MFNYKILVMVSIKKIQELQLNMLLEFDKICRRNNIKYILFGGTLLGAIRHKGFIPWDDDIDVGLLRNDYEKFIKIAKEELPGSLFLQHTSTDKKSIFPFVKIRKKHTLFLEKGTRKIKMNQGVFIDVFPLDNYNSQDKKNIKILRRVNILMNLMIKGHSKFIYNKSKWYLQPFKILMKVFVFVPSKWFIKRIDIELSKLKSIKADYVNHYTNGISKKRLDRFKIEKSAFDNLIEVEFNDNFFPVPKNYDLILKRCYGDYMKLPPKEKQIPHHGVHVSLEE